MTGYGKCPSMSIVILELSMQRVLLVRFRYAVRNLNIQ